MRDRQDIQKTIKAALSWAAFLSGATDYAKPQRRDSVVHKDRLADRHRACENIATCRPQFLAGAEAAPCSANRQLRSPRNRVFRHHVVGIGETIVFELHAEAFALREPPIHDAENFTAALQRGRYQNLPAGARIGFEDSHIMAVFRGDACCFQPAWSRPLTTQGQRLFTAVSAGLASISNTIQDIGAPRRDTIIVSTSTVMATEWLMPRMQLTPNGSHLPSIK